MWPLMIVLCVLCAVEGTRFAFFRKIVEKGGGGRRVFGGTAADAHAWPSACALLDRALTGRCSCAVVAPRWAVTAAHCAKPTVAYVQYNSNGVHQLAMVHFVYSHPQFKAVEKDLGSGMDVVTLHNDIGLVRTRAEMVVPGAPHPIQDPISSKTFYDIKDIIGETIDVLGYGMSEESGLGERLRTVQLKLVPCERDDWQYCACALGDARGVCEGDSGGPVLYNGTQIGVTVMGPTECGAPVDPQFGTMSAFTQLRPYARLLDDKIRDVDAEVRLRSRSCHARACAALVTMLACGLLY